MRIVFAAIPAYGHVYPMLPLAGACVDAGHDVVVATGDPFVGHLKLPTASAFPVGMDLDQAILQTKQRHPGVDGLELTIAMFADTTAGVVIDKLVPVLAEFGPDLVIFEGMNIGAGIAANILGIPSVAFSIGMAQALIGFIDAAALDYHRDGWTSRGLAAPADSSSFAGRLIDPTPPSLLRFSGGEQVSRIPIRPVAYGETGGALPSWLAGPATRPRVYLTLGTVSYGAVEVLQRAVNEIAAHDLDVLVAVGPVGDPDALGRVPANVHVERFVAQAQVLGLVDLVVHHGGYGTVLGVLAAGLPQLILPQGADQFHNAGSLAELGAARALLGDQQVPGAIGDAVAALLAVDAPERSVIAGLRDEIAALPAPADVVSELDKLVAGG
jgi:UDP:flavonoid glycosyltransferase YjiC (YdhE family)